MHFISYIVFLAICVGAYFLVRRFAKEECLPFFTAVIFIVGLYAPDMAIGQYVVSMNTVFMPLVFLCLISIFRKEESKAKKLLFQFMIIIGAAFAVRFLESIFFACQGFGAIDWRDFGSFISLAVSFVSASLIGKVLSPYFVKNNYLFNASFLATVSAIDASIFALLRIAFVNGVTAKYVFVCILLAVVFAAISAYLIMLVEHTLIPASYKREESMQAILEEEPTEAVVEDFSEEVPAEEPAKDNSEEGEEEPAEPEE